MLLHQNPVYLLSGDGELIWIQNTFENSSLGKYEKAIESYTKALELNNKLFGENHPDTATSFSTLGQSEDIHEGKMANSVHCKQDSCSVITP